MFFKDNPFYLLAVHTTDGAEVIEQSFRRKYETAQEREKKNLKEAKTVLLKSVERSGAEFYWLPGLSREKAFSLVSMILEKGDVPDGLLYSLPSESRIILELNLLLYGMKKEMALFLKDLCENYDALSPEKSARFINRDREQAGIAPLRHISYIEMQKRLLMDEIGEALNILKKDMGILAYGKLLAKLGETVKGTTLFCKMLIDYEEELPAVLETWEKDLDYALCLSLRHFPQGLSLAEEKTEACITLLRPLTIRRGIWPMAPLLQRIGETARIFRNEGKEKEAAALENLFPLGEFEGIKEALDKMGQEELPPFPSWEKVPSSLGDIPRIKAEKGERSLLPLLLLAVLLIMTLLWLGGRTIS